MVASLSPPPPVSSTEWKCRLGGRGGQQQRKRRGFQRLCQGEAGVDLEGIRGWGGCWSPVGCQHDLRGEENPVRIRTSLIALLRNSLHHTDALTASQTCATWNCLWLRVDVCFLLPFYANFHTFCKVLKKMERKSNECAYYVKSLFPPSNMRLKHYNSLVDAIVIKYSTLFIISGGTRLKI